MTDSMPWTKYAAPIFTLSRHRHRRVLSLVIASICPSVRPSIRPSACPSVRPNRSSRSNSLRISAISLKFGGMMHSTMEQIAILNDHAWTILWAPQNYPFFYDRLFRPGLRDDATALTLKDYRYQPEIWKHEADSLFKMSRSVRLWNFHYSLGPGPKNAVTPLTR